MFEDLNPLDKTTAVLEIVIMLVIALLIGFLTAWLIQKRKKKDEEKDEKELKEAKNKIEALEKEVKTLQEESQNLKKQLSETKQASKQNKISENKIKELETTLNKLKEENASITEELHDQEKLNHELTYKLNQPAPKFKSKEEAAEILGFKLAKEEEKEDLTIIKGIGPFIQEKLNELGIYNIEQISDFTIDTVIKVTDAIEYFPGRIQRDFWVEQANQILNDREKENSAS